MPSLLLLEVEGAHRGQTEIQCLRSSEFNLLKEHCVAWRTETLQTLLRSLEETRAHAGTGTSERAHTRALSGY